MKEHGKKKYETLMDWVGLHLSVYAVTGLVSLIDVKLIEPNGSSEGFATINGFVHDTVGVHMTLYTITDWLGLCLDLPFWGLCSSFGGDVFSKWIVSFCYLADCIVS